MTVFTKPCKLDKKPIAPLNNEHLVCSNEDVESCDEQLLASLRQKRISTATTLFLFLTALGVMCIGIIGGIAIYKAYGRAQMRNLRFHGFCGVPYDSNTIDNNAMIYMNSKWRDGSMDDEAIFRSFANNLLKNEDNTFFKEEFELDLSDEESYSKVNVPSFRDGRSGRFLHDFKQNQSAIIDNESGRCFVMPLDRETVLPPKSMYDLVTRMWSGYYKIDTEIVRKNMRVITPAITNTSEIASRIADECEGKSIFMLEKFVNGVFKRSADLPENGKYAEFSGQNIVELNIININEIN